MPSSGQPHPDREFLEHRADVIKMLRKAFPDVDPEDVYQEAWVEVLKVRRSGEVVGDLRLLLRKKAKDRAIDIVRKVSPTPLPVTGPIFTNRRDPDPQPEEIAEWSVDAAVVRRVVAELGPREAAIIKMRFDLGMTTLEIMRALGISRKRLEKIVTRVYKTVLEQLTADESGETPVSRRQRSLLLMCLQGYASPAQWEKARRQLADDPACRAMLAQMRETVDRVAAVLPLPVLGEAYRQQGVGMFEHLNQSSAALRDAITVAAPRVSGQSWFEPVTGSVTTLGAAGAAKVVVICLSLGGGAAVCIDAGVFGRDDPAAAVAAQGKPRTKPAKEERAAKVKPRPVPKPTPKPATEPAARPASVVPPPTTNGPAAPSPSPPGSEEFGVGSVGSQPASTEPAAAPIDGGGEFTP